LIFGNVEIPEDEVHDTRFSRSYLRSKLEHLINDRLDQVDKKISKKCNKNHENKSKNKSLLLSKSEFEEFEYFSHF